MKTHIALFAVICVVTFGFGCSQSANNSSYNGMNHNMNMPMNHNGMSSNEMDHSMMQSSPNASSAPYDLQFLDTMIAHHRGAVDMAGPCATNAQHAEVKTLCANVISS